MSRVFADTVYFIARLNRRDQYHEQAISLSRRLDARLVTTEWVLLEVADGFANTEHRGRIRELIYRLRQSSVTEVVPVSSELLDRALDLYHQHQDKQWTLTDCTSFLVMQQHGISQALTGDHHFEQAGFVALLK